MKSSLVQWSGTSRWSRLKHFHLEVSGEKGITLKSRISSRFPVQSRSIPKVKKMFVLLSSWCQDPSSGRVPSGSICPWPHRTELGTAQEKQQWASFLKMWKSTEALDPHSHAFSAWPPARYQLVFSQSPWRPGGMFLTHSTNGGQALA